MGHPVAFPKYKSKKSMINPLFYLSLYDLLVGSLIIRHCLKYEELSGDGVYSWLVTKQN